MCLNINYLLLIGGVSILKASVHSILICQAGDGIYITVRVGGRILLLCSTSILYPIFDSWLNTITYLPYSWFTTVAMVTIVIGILSTLQQRTPCYINTIGPWSGSTAQCIMIMHDMLQCILYSISPFSHALPMYIAHLPNPSQVWGC